MLPPASNENIWRRYETWCFKGWSKWLLPWGYMYETRASQPSSLTSANIHETLMDLSFVLMFWTIEHSKFWFQREIKTCFVKELGWWPALSSRVHCLCWGEVRGGFSHFLLPSFVKKQVFERGLIGTEGNATLLFSRITAIFRLMLSGDIFRVCVYHSLERFQHGIGCVVICLIILHFCHERKKKTNQTTNQTKTHTHAPNP